jgi:pantetheine-phosphate adenylyltransferase
VKIAVGGTFNVIHKGHELLFETAFRVGDSVEVGLTSDEFAKSIKSVPVAPYFQRKANLIGFLERYGKPFNVVMISDMKGTAATSETIDAIVVSPETKEHADHINELRRRNGLKALKVYPIKEVRADDTMVISSSRIVKGEIDKDGRLMMPMKIAVGSRSMLSGTSSHRPSASWKSSALSPTRALGSSRAKSGPSRARSSEPRARWRRPEPISEWASRPVCSTTASSTSIWTFSTVQS